jgi:metal-responsive CopG/Arc/MetJ family transcriptional regulator
MKKDYDFSKGKRGAGVRVPSGKTRITIRLDQDVLDWFRTRVNAAGGGNCQTLIHDALREYVQQPNEPLETRCGGSFAKSCSLGCCQATTMIGHRHVHRRRP